MTIGQAIRRQRRRNRRVLSYLVWELTWTRRLRLVTSSSELIC